MEDRPCPGHRRRGVLLGGKADLARRLRDPMECTRLTGRGDLPAVDIEHCFGDARGLYLIEGEVQRRLVPSSGKET